METKPTRFTSGLRRVTAQALTQARYDKLTNDVATFLKPYQAALHRWYLQQAGGDDVTVRALLQLREAWTLHGGVRTVALYNVPGVHHCRFDIELTPQRRALPSMPHRFEWAAVEDSFLSVMDTQSLHTLVGLQEERDKFNKYLKEDEAYTALEPFRTVGQLLETLPDMKPHVEVAMKRLGFTADKPPSEQPLVDPAALAKTLGLPV